MIEQKAIIEPEKIGIAKLTFRHDQNTVIADFKLLLPFSKTQMHLVSNPDNHWQIPDDGQD